MEKVIKVAPRETLLSKDYMFELSAWTSRVALTRGKLVEWGTLTLYNHLDQGGVVLTGEGNPIDIYPGVFDDSHGEASNGEWISDQRRRGYPCRRPRKTLLGRLQLYDAIGIIIGRAVRHERRREDVAEVRELLARFSPIWRARYLNEVRRLHREYAGTPAMYYGAAIRRLRARLYAELTALKTQD